jgi:hypothetical protein
MYQNDPVELTRKTAEDVKDLLSGPGEGFTFPSILEVSWI